MFSFLKTAHTGKIEGESDSDDDENKAKDFEVLVCETAPEFSGHATAKRLNEAGI